MARQLEVRDAVMAFKCLHGLAQAYLRSKFIARADVHTRHRNKLDVLLLRTATGQRSFVHIQSHSALMNYLRLLWFDSHCRVIFMGVRA